MSRPDYQPEEWGPSAWTFLHTISFAYPENPDEATRAGMQQFFASLGHVLPCQKCRLNYHKHLQEIREDPFKNRDTLTRWVVELHNQVNKAQHKQLYEYNDVKDMYTGNHLLCGAQNSEKTTKTSKTKKPALVARFSNSPFFGFTITIVILVIVLLLLCTLVGVQCQRTCRGSSRLLLR